MADQFQPLIKQVLDVDISAQGLGWSSYSQSSPSRKEWNNLPCVLICPVGKDDLYYSAFNQKDLVSSYNVFLVVDNKLVNVDAPSADTFQKMVIRLFMPMPPLLEANGAYMSRVIPDAQFDRSLFPVGYSVSCSVINVSWIF